MFELSFDICFALYLVQGTAGNSALSLLLQCVLDFHILAVILDSSFELHTLFVVAALSCNNTFAYIHPQSLLFPDLPSPHYYTLPLIHLIADIFQGGLCNQNVW